MKKILITGISGFIGQALEKRLLAEGFEVHGLYESTGSISKNSEAVIKHKANLKDYGRVKKVVKTIEPNFIIHLAAKTEVALSFDNYLEVSEVNYIGTVNLVEAARQVGSKHLELFIMASTMETYGQQASKEEVLKAAEGTGPMPKPVTEDTPQRPMAPYAVAKLACEYYLRYMEYAYNFPFCGFRQTNAYGRHDNEFFVVEQIITQMLQSDKVFLGNSEPYRNFLYIDDLIDLYLTVIKNPEKARGNFFVTGPDNAITIKELSEIIAKKLNWKGDINWGHKPPRPGEVYYLNSNPAKAKQVLGWEPKISLDEGLERTIQIWKQNYASPKGQQVRPRST